MNQDHFPGHQQAVIKNNLVISILSFASHEEISSTLSKIDYDEVVDLCSIQQSPAIGYAWNGAFFSRKPYPSWILNTVGNWVAPVEIPIGSYRWSEKNQQWIPYNPNDDCQDC